MKKTLFDLLAEGREEVPIGDLYPLLAHAIGKNREFILAHPEHIPAHSEIEKWEEFLKRRKNGEPLAYITGRKEFYSLSFKVTRNTLIPRPETELLVEEIIRRNPESLLDIGTGVGNIAVSVKYYLQSCRVVATDVSEETLQIARENACTILGHHGISFIRSDYFSHLQVQKFAIIASNPPYIKRARFRTLQPEIRDWEPRLALDGGLDGLAGYRRILEGGREHLEKGGLMVLEVDPEVIDGLLILLREGSFSHGGTERGIKNKERNGTGGVEPGLECGGRNRIRGGTYRQKKKERYRIEGICTDLTGDERLLILKAL